MRQDETYWREGFNFDFETDDGKEISHDFDFIEVCGDNQYFICQGSFFSLIGRGEAEGEKTICRSLEWINSEII